MDKRFTKALWVKQLEAEAPIRAILGWAGARNANDDDIAICELIKINLELTGYQVFVANDGEIGFALAKLPNPIHLVEYTVQRWSRAD